MLSAPFLALSPPKEAYADTQAWAKTYGGWADDIPTSIQQTADGGYVIAGETRSFGTGGAWVLKLDSDGNVQWEKLYVGGGLFSIQQTSDGGYIGAGFKIGAGFEQNPWLIKLTSDGNIDWEKMYPTFGLARMIRQTIDGGYISIWDTTRMESDQHDSIQVVKTDSGGNIEWQNRYEEDRWTYASSVRQTADRGYIVGASMNGDETFGMWILKLDSDGNLEWERVYGKNLGGDLDLTTDGGLVLADPGSNLVLKLNSNGDIEWEQELSGNFRLHSVQQTSDGSYALSGTSFDVPFDVALVKLDENGKIEWKHAYGGSGHEFQRSMVRTVDDGYVLASSTESFGVRHNDFWILKLDSSGDIPGCAKDIVHDIVIDSNESTTPVRGTSADVVSTTTGAIDSSTTVKDTAARVGVVCEASVPPPTKDCSQPTITATDDSEVIYGTGGDDVINGMGGDDTINGLGGNDIICGGSGDDTISGGGGSDTIYGGYGNDIISGGLGNDTLNGGAGNDSLAGNGGNDKLIGSSGNDTLNGKDGVVNNDSLDGGFGTDTCNSNPDPEVNCEL